MKKIVVIGVGSLGGYLAEKISEIDNVKTLTLLDPDIVEVKNLKNSIYTKAHVGLPKVEAMKLIISQHTDLEIQTHQIEYHCNITHLPFADLIIDCRDVITKRCDDIDVRLYVSFEKLIIDCQRNNNVTQRNGRYIKGLSKSQLSYLTSVVAQLISSKKIKEMIKEEIVDSYPIDAPMKSMSKSLRLRKNRPKNMIVKYHPGHEKIKNLDDYLPEIVNVNKTKDLTVVVGHESCLGDSIQRIPKNELVCYNAAEKAISTITNSLNLPYECYTIVLNHVSRNEAYIELLPETGGA